MPDAVDDGVATPTTAVVAGSNSSSQTWPLPKSTSFKIQSVSASITGAGGAATTAELQIVLPTGEVVAAERQSSSIPAGDTGVATWALRLTGGGSQGPPGPPGSTDLDMVRGANLGGFSVPPFSFQQFDLDTIYTDTLGYWSAGTPYRFTVKKAGEYSISGFALWDGTISYKVNGGAIEGFPAAFRGPTSEGFCWGNTIRSFALNDTIDWQAGNPLSGTQATASMNVALVWLHS
jgi:hypothetical protein